MNELQKIARAFQAVSSRGQENRAALATVIRVTGSAYRRPGARMLVVFNEDGNPETAGTISGGCLERDVIERAKRVCKTKIAEIARYDSTENADRIFGTATGCGGAIEILIEAVSDLHTLEFLRFLDRIIETRTAGAAAVIIPDNHHSGAKAFRTERLLFTADDDCRRTIVNAEVLDDVISAARGEFHSQIKSYKVDKGTSPVCEVFVESIQPAPSVVIFGAGDDTQPLARFCSEVGWHVSVFDHRAALANRERFPLADEIVVARPETVMEKINFDRRTFAVLMTHNYEHDFELLRKLLPSNCRYVGCLGTKKRTNKMLLELREEGGWQPDSEQLNKIYAPVGLDTGAETPEEIAVSILAEMRAVLSKRAGGHLRNINAPIHGEPLEYQINGAIKKKNPAETGRLITADEKSGKAIVHTPKTVAAEAAI